MNDAHWHITLNHFPIIGSVFGLGILIFGLLLKNNSVKNTAYGLFIVSAIFTFASMATGEGAEDVVVNFPEIGRAVIHEHEEIAEKFAIVSYLLGVFSIVAFIFNVKQKAKANLISYLVLILALAAVGLSFYVGNTGGEVRHTEIRNDVSLPGKSQEGGAEDAD